MLIHYNDLYSPALHKTLTVMKLTILVDPSLVIIDLFLIQLIHALVWTKRGEEIFACSVYDHAPGKEPLLQGYFNLQFLSTLAWSLFLHSQFV